MGLLGAPTFPMLRDSVQKHFSEITYAEGIGFEPHAAENSVTFANGSQILFRSLEDFERLRGSNLAWFGVDELTYCPEEAWFRLEGRLRDRNANRLCGFAAWTPKGYDWVHKRFVAKRTEDYMVVHAIPKENRFLADGYYERLEQSYDANFYRQEVLGEYLSMAGGRAYYAFAPENLREAPYTPSLPICWSLDFNIDPLCSVIAQIEDVATRDDSFNGRRRLKVRVLDEIFLRDATTEDACREFLRKTQEWAKYRPITVQIYGDASGYAGKTSGQTDYEMVQRFFARESNYRVQICSHLRERRANGGVRDRVNAVNGMLCSVSGDQSLFIDPRCNELIEDLQSVRFRLDSNKNPTGDLDKTEHLRTHMSDALGYLIRQAADSGDLKQGGGFRTEFLG